ncbi:unnamed protein product, partial [Owenia fusiformis]
GRHNNHGGKRRGSKGGIEYGLGRRQSNTNSEQEQCPQDPVVTDPLLGLGARPKVHSKTFNNDKHRGGHRDNTDTHDTSQITRDEHSKSQGLTQRGQQINQNGRSNRQQRQPGQRDQRQSLGKKDHHLQDDNSSGGNSSFYGRIWRNSSHGQNSSSFESNIEQGYNQRGKKSLLGPVPSDLSEMEWIGQNPRRGCMPNNPQNNQGSVHDGVYNNQGSVLDRAYSNRGSVHDRAHINQGSVHDRAYRNQGSFHDRPHSNQG